MAYEVLYLQTGETPARLDRWWIDRVFSEGVNDVQAGDLAVSERAGAANLSVDVAAGAAIVDGDDTTDQGAYLVRLTAGVNLPLAAPPATDSRIDLVVLRVLDSTATGVGDGTTDGAVVEVVQGAPAAAPVAPALPATAIPLAEVTVAAGDTAITNNEIADRRAQLNAETLDVGTQSIPLTTAEREAMNDPQPGTLVFDTDLGSLMAYDGVAWGAPDPETAADVQTLTASATWTKPAGARRVKVELWGGGGGGANGNGASNPFVGGAGGGGYVSEVFDADALPASVAVTVGAGGLGVTGQNNGNPGGSSSFGSLLSVTGGGGGIFQNSSWAKGGKGGGIDGGSGAPGGGAYPGDGSYSGGGGGGANGVGGGSIWGGGGGGGTQSSTTPQAGGPSLHGGKGGTADPSSEAPRDGTAPAGGGGSVVAATAAGDGARGEARITTYY